MTYTHTIILSRRWGNRQPMNRLCKTGKIETSFTISTQCFEMTACDKVFSIGLKNKKLIKWKSYKVIELKNEIHK